MHSLHLKAAALPTLKPPISWDPIISWILQSRQQGFTPWERGWASRFSDLGLELGNARLLDGIHTFSAATLKVCEGGNHFAILGLSCKPSVFRGRRVRLKLPIPSPGICCLSVLKVCSCSKLLFERLKPPPRT